MKRSHWYKFAPFIVFVFGLVIAALIASYTAKENRQQANDAFDTLSARTAAQIQRRMSLYEYGLRGMRGSLIAGGEIHITRQIFDYYSQSRDIDREFPGARGFGFIRRVPVKDELSFLASARKDGWPDFSIRQLTPHDSERFVIQYIAPVERNRQAVGLDIASENNRRTAALRSLSTGNPAITEPITLVQADGKKNKGFLIILAAYRNGFPLTTLAERDTATYGWAYSPIVMDEVMADFDYQQGRVAIQIHDNNAPSEAQTFFTSTGINDALNPRFKRTIHVPVFGRDWAVDVQARPLFIEQLNQDAPSTILLIGIVLSALLAVLTYIQQLAHERALKLNSADALHRANERYRSLVEGVSDYAIIHLDLSGRITAWNTGAEKIKGYTAEEAIGQHFSIFYPEENRPSDYFDKKLAHVRTIGADQEEGWRLRKDGTRFWGYVTITAIRNVRGEITGYSKITRDLTEQRQQAIALEALSALQQAILNNAGIAIIATDTEGVITLFNPSAERLLGYTAEEMIGINTPAKFHDAQEVMAGAIALTEALGSPIEPGFEVFVAKATQGVVDTNEWTYITKEGRRVPVLLSVTSLVNEHGHLFGYVGLAVDLTNQKLHEEELEAARHQAERATRAKSDFLANMSHEIRTPMNAILGMTQLVLQGELQGQQRDYLSKAFAASKALLSILNDILDYSKIEAGRMDLEEREMSLEEVLSNTLTLFSAQAEQKGLELVFDAPAELPGMLYGDPLRLNQVLSNLIGNAIKFTPEGAVTLKVEHRPGRQSNFSLIRLSVSDTGIGMSEEQLSHLFTPFSQADTSITRRFGGTGLGLSISKHLVELMGGHLEATSTLNEGSCFSFSLELKHLDAIPFRQETLQHIGIRNALVVDDQQSAALVLRLQLGSWGVPAQIATSGVDAIAMVEEADKNNKPFDLILMDWKMPGMDGLTVIAELEARIRSGRLRQQPVILMVSAYSREALVRKISGLNVAAVLSKPVMPSSLFNTLTTLGAPKSDHAVANATADFTRYQTLALPLQGTRILLAEDNELNQQVAMAFLTSAGILVQVAKNGREALELVQAAHFDLVLMDLQMPEMGGLEATQRIRALPAYATLPIVAMTAAVRAADQQACLDAGMNDFVGKPIDPDKLISTLLKWLKPAHLGETTQLPRREPLSAPSVPVGLGEHPGIDVSGALYRMANDAQLYLSLLRSFSARTNDVRAELAAAGRTDALPGLLHKLKGESGNLGLTVLSTRCAEAEVAVAEQNMIDQHLNMIDAELQSLALHLQQVLSAPPQQALIKEKTALSAEQRAELVSKAEVLFPLLTAQRMQALPAADEIARLVKDTQVAEEFNAVQELIRQLQFKSAHIALGKLIASLENTN